MKNQIQLEQWLRSFKLPGPSRELERRLFDQPGPLPDTRRKSGVTKPQFASWLVAATACALIVGGLSRQTTSEVLFWNPAGHTHSLATAALSNQFYAAYLPGAHSLWNPSLPTKLKWTNSESLPSGKAFGVHSTTNFLRQ